MLDLHTRQEEQKEILSVEITGKLDAKTSPDFDRFFEKAVRNGNLLFILNLEKLEYISSAGFASLIGLYEKLKKSGGGLSLIRLNDELKMLFEFFGFNRVIRIFPDTQEAAAYLSKLISSEDYIQIKATDTIPADSVRPKTEAAPLSEVSEGEDKMLNESGTKPTQIPVIQPESKPSIPEISAEPIVSLEEEIRELRKKEAERIKTIEYEKRKEYREKEKMKINFPEPLLFYCSHCGNKIRVHRSGEFLCPNCKESFSVSSQGEIRYATEKEKQGAVV